MLFFGVGWQIEINGPWIYTLNKKLSAQLHKYIIYSVRAKHACIPLSTRQFRPQTYLHFEFNRCRRVE